MNEAQKLEARVGKERYAVLLHEAITTGTLIQRGEFNQEAYTYELRDGSVVTFWGRFKLVKAHTQKP